MNDPADRDIATIAASAARSLLGRMRRVYRWLILLHAAENVALVAAACVVALCGLAAMDWLLRLPGPARLTGVLACTVGAAVLSWKRLVRPVVLRPSLTDAAKALESAAGVEEDCLSSGVEFALRGEVAGLAGMAIVSAEQASRPLRLRDAVDWRRRFVRPLVGMVLVCIWGWSVTVNPGWWQTAAARLAWPVRQVQWPTRFMVYSPQAGRILKVPRGQSHTLRARLLRGSGDEGIRLVLAAQPGTLERVAMRLADNGWFLASVPVNRLTKFWFEAGDYSGRARPGVLLPVERPRVLEAVARVAPPEYTGQPARSVLLGGRPVRVPVGSDLVLSVLFAKAIASADGQAAAWALLRSAASGEAETARREIRMSFADSSRRRLMVRFRCERDVTVRVRATDVDGITSRLSDGYTFLAVDDKPLRVTLREPKGTIFLTERADFLVLAEIEDDWAVEAVRLVAEEERAAAGATGSRRAARQQRGRFAPEPESLHIVSRKPFEAVLRWRLSVADLRLKTGQEAVCWLQVRDKPGRRQSAGCRCGITVE